jgi:colicin import membrane protein
MESVASNKKGFIGTVLFHGAFLTAFLIFSLGAPYPPAPEQGIMVNFGLDEKGSGESEPIVNDKEKPVVVTEEKAVPKEEGKILTQDVEEAPVIDSKKTKEKKEIPKTTPVKKEVVVVKKAVPMKEERKVNARALYTGRKSDSKNTAGEGVTDGKGNQGSPFGSVDSKNHAAGDSRGNGGPKFDLEGRNPENIGMPEKTFMSDGDVVIEVTVDKSGKVTNARPGKGSTTQDITNINSAMKAAMVTTFSQKTDNAEPIQKGTITYHFTLK